MKNKESLKDCITYLQSIEKENLELNESAIFSVYESRDNQSLAIKVLSVFGGIMASLAFLGFLGLAGLFESDTALLIFGMLCIAAAIGINKKYDKIIFDTFSVSFYLIGFIILAFSLSKMGANENTISGIFILLSFLSLSIVHSYILSFISVLIINGSILMLVFSNRIYELMYLYSILLALLLTYIFLKEAKIISTKKALSRLYNPIRIGLIFSFLAALISISKKGIMPISTQYMVLSSVFIIAIIIYTISPILEILNVNKTTQKTAIYAFSTLLLLPTAAFPALSGGILIIMLSFRANYKTAFVIGIIAFLYAISQYYYDLHFTLLSKSILLLISGILFIILYLITKQKLTSNEKI